MRPARLPSTPLSPLAAINSSHADLLVSFRTHFCVIQFPAAFTFQTDHSFRYLPLTRRPHPPPPYIDLAAAKRGGRGRARSSVRARRRPDLNPAPAASNGALPASSNGPLPTASNGPLPTASFVVPTAAGPADDEVRRNALLRRLNQITQQRSRLERRVSRDSGKVSPTNRSQSHDLDDPALDGDLQVLARIHRTGSDVPAKSTARAADEVLVNGSRRSAGLSKRRRGDSGIDARERDSSLRRDGSPRNGRHTPHKRVQSVAPRGASLRLDIDPVGKDSVGKLDLMLVDGGRSAKGSPTATPPTTPAIGQRGSGRVRTPSVLLSSHPGEKIPPLKPTAASKNRQGAYCLRIVKDMLRLKDGFGFSKPIDQLWAIDQLPGYFDIVRHPMDLDTVRQRLESGHYLTSPGKEEVEEVSFDATAFKEDMRLVFSNAQTYNRPGDIFFEASKRLSDKFETKMAHMPSLEQLAVQAAKKNKKRKKGQAGASEGGRKNDSGKRRKSGEAVSSGLPKNRTTGKKKTPSGGSGKPKTPTAGSGRKKTGAKTAPVAVKNVDSMSAEELEARFRALERQRAVTLPGSPAASSTGLSSYVAEAQALYDVKATDEEVIELSQSIFKLPAEKIKKVIAMASKNQNESVEVTQDEEIVLDFESMSNRTLRDIQALVRQTLYRNKKAPIETGPNADVFQMDHSKVLDEMDKVEAEQRRRGKGSSSGNGKDKNQRSFYDSESSSDSDDSDGSGSESDDEGSSSGASDSSDDDESGSDYMRRTRERNLAHQQAMQAAGTPLPNPSYQNRGPST